MKLTVAAVIVSITALAVTQAQAVIEVDTSFEFTDVSGSFTLGTTPNTVTFNNGLAQSVAIFPLYHSGLNAWMIEPLQTGEIIFETEALFVNLWLRDQTPTASLLTFYDASDQVLAQFNGLDIAFKNIVVNNIGPIARITLQNNGSVGWAVIDDFSFSTTPVPSPSGVAVLTLAGLGLARRRRR